MARAAYTLLLWIALPLICLRLLWRARRQGEYLRHWGERFGGYDLRPARPVIWLHAVSVGEARAAEPLVTAMTQRFPAFELVITCMTPTGRATAIALYGSLASVVYLPYDYPFAVRRFLARFRPRVGIVMETEVWPNLLALCNDAHVPVLLVNARLSERSQRRYLRVPRLAGAAFSAFTQVAAQSAADAARIGALRKTGMVVTGNLKFDVAPDAQLLARGAAWHGQVGGRRVFLAASTREGEEALLLPLLRALAAAGYLCVIVPRHPQRFAEVTELLIGAGLRTARRSSGLPAADVEAWVGDSMGEMAAYYALADCAYIGGSLLPFGGQNLIEAAACGCPALVGPHTWNFSEAAEGAVAAGAAQRVTDADHLAVAVQRLLADPAGRAVMRERAFGFASAHRGATDRTMALIAPLLARPAGVTTGGRARFCADSPSG